MSVDFADTCTLDWFIKLNSLESSLLFKCIFSYFNFGPLVSFIIAVVFVFELSPAFFPRTGRSLEKALE